MGFSDYRSQIWKLRDAASRGLKTKPGDRSACLAAFFEPAGFQPQAAKDI
jgi:hypothetical protein